MFFSAPRALVVDASAGVDVVGEVDGWDERMDAWIAERVQLFAPPGFPYEMADALLLSRRLPPVAVRAQLRALDALQISIADDRAMDVLECFGLAAHHGLTVYDAAYLQLAIFLEAELATRDKALARAAREEGLVVHD
jgi:predicted nucleic acid-binding protein